MNIINQIINSKKYLINRFNIHKFICEGVEIYIEAFNDDSIFTKFTFNSEMLCHYAYRIEDQKICFSHGLNIKYGNEFGNVQTEADLKKFCNMLAKIEIFK